MVLTSWPQRDRRPGEWSDGVLAVIESTISPYQQQGEESKFYMTKDDGYAALACVTTNTHATEELADRNL